MRPHQRRQGWMRSWRRAPLRAPLLGRGLLQLLENLLWRWSALGLRLWLHRLLVRLYVVLGVHINYDFWEQL